MIGERAISLLVILFVLCIGVLAFNGEVSVVNVPATIMSLVVLIFLFGMFISANSKLAGLMDECVALDDSLEGRDEIYREVNKQIIEEHNDAIDVAISMKLRCATQRTVMTPSQIETVDKQMATLAKLEETTARKTPGRNCS